MYKKTQEYFERVDSILLGRNLIVEKITINDNYIRVILSIGYIEYTTIGIFSGTSHNNLPVFITLKNIGGEFYIADTSIYWRGFPDSLIFVIAIICLLSLVIERYKKFKETGKFL